MVSVPEVGAQYVARHTTGGDDESFGWYRVTVLDVDPRMRKTLCFFDDYGYTEWLSYSSSLRLYNESSQYLRVLPNQVSETARSTCSSCPTRCMRKVAVFGRPVQPGVLVGACMLI